MSNEYPGMKEIRALLEARYSKAYHRVSIEEISPFRGVHVVMFIVEASTYIHKRVAIVKDGRLENDIIAATE